MTPAVAIPVALLLFVAAATRALGAAAQAPAPAAAQTVWSGVYTDAQAERGRGFYAEHCAECHGDTLQGGQGKALSDKRFWTDWQETTVDYLLDQVSKNMPFSEDGSLAGTLAPDVYADIVAHILKANGFPPGTRDLNAASSAGVQIVHKDGARELPEGALVRIVGCLEKGSGGWQLVKVARPSRVRSSRAAPKDNADAPLGDRSYALKFVLTPLDKYAGQKMAATGLLLGEGGSGGINVSTVTSVAQACQ